MYWVGQLYQLAQHAEINIFSNPILLHICMRISQI